MNNKKAIAVTLLAIGTAAAMGQSTQTKKVAIDVECALAIQLVLGDMAKAPPYATASPFLPEEDRGFEKLLKREVSSIECSIANSDITVTFVSASDTRDGALTYLIDRRKMEITRRAFRF